MITLSDKPLNSSYRYGSRLHIINMTYPFVGFYNCHYADKGDTEEESSSTYLFVHDLEHLAVRKLKEPIIVTQNKGAVIPCKPTSPDVQVRLINSSLLDNVALLQKTVPDETLYDYDPKYGFFTRDTKTPGKQSFYCGFLKELKLEYFPVLVTIETSISRLPAPHLKDLNEGHTDVGGELTLECTISAKNDVHFHWGTPSQAFRTHVIKVVRQGELSVGTLVIYNIVKSDSGTYFCNITDNQQHISYSKVDIKVFDTNEHFLTVETENGTANSTLTSAGEPPVQWNLTVRGHPKPIVKWFNNRNESIPMEYGSKYEAWYNSSASRAILKIKNLTITDTGNFTLLVVSRDSENRIFYLNVTDKPKMSLNVKLFYLLNSSSTMQCYAYANPEPQFQWYLKFCQSTACDYVPVNGTVSKINKFEFVSEVAINVTENGQLKCLAKNYRGISSVTKTIYVSDIKNGFDVFTLDSDVDINEEDKVVTIAEGDKAAVTCGASNQMYSDINWLFNDKLLVNNDEIRLTKSSTKYSNKLELELQHPSISDSGVYSCRITNKSGKYLSHKMTFNVTSPEPLQIINTTLQEKREINLPDRLVLFCKVSGIPKPTIKWYKNGVAFQTSETKRIHISQDKETISFAHTAAQDEGTYKCEAKNRLGSVTKQQTVKFKNLPQAAYGWFLTIIILLSLISIGTIIFIVFKIQREKQQQRELEILGLTNFRNGAVENINPELGIDEQADLLPYDQKWEFPREHLKLDKQLGSGAFGVVMKAVAKNIVEREYETTVAVKMVKKNTDHACIKALASELKIMIHLGKHLNIVNLLGACTKNVAKRELLVIVEFCQFGNLHNYLLKHRENYLDQVDSKSGRINYVTSQKCLNWTSDSDNEGNVQLNSLGYIDMRLSKDNKKSVVPTSCDITDYRTNPNIDVRPTTNMAEIYQSEDGITLNKDTGKTICTKDLLTWSFQVARGMGYLASRKVLHGDLAARNILLTNDNVVKICDFGLSRSTYKNMNYKKQCDGPLPVKWMAVESITDGIFSTQSDVWSFGVVLWEFFSLAKTPYPGMEADEIFFRKLMDGYRMESPQYASKEVYKIITACWSHKPEDRPSFEKLSKLLGNLLGETVRKHYIDLNDPYLVMNTQRLGDGESDYLAMLRPLTFGTPSSPYVNEIATKELSEDSGYVCMKPNARLGLMEDVPMIELSDPKLNPEEGNTTAANAAAMN
ncbi:vascular endothelial growth factor receptor 1 isoform X2 [Anoplophora glabripennis]|nr:vascular endothelial growth factor receptor 1 isoform X2 [Anoplophora glabripennis]